MDYYYQSLEDLPKNSTDLYVCYCGIEQCRPNHSYGPHAREDSYVIHIILKGKGLFRIGDMTYQLHEGQAFLIPHHMSAYYKADSLNPWQYIWIGFDGVLSYEVIRNSGFRSGCFVIDIPDTSIFKKTVESMLSTSEGTYSNSMMRTSNLFYFFGLLAKNHESNSNHNTELLARTIYVNQITEYISKNFSKKLRIQELADSIGINRSYLTAIFKKEKGISPQKYLVNLRMEKAASMLKESPLSIGQIAFYVGYNDPLAFSKIFKQYHGVSPRTYRQETEQKINY